MNRRDLLKGSISAGAAAIAAPLLKLFPEEYFVKHSITAPVAWWSNAIDTAKLTPEMLKAAIDKCKSQCQYNDALNVHISKYVWKSYEELW